MRDPPSHASERKQEQPRGCSCIVAFPARSGKAHRDRELKDEAEEAGVCFREPELEEGLISGTGLVPGEVNAFRFGAFGAVDDVLPELPEETPPFGVLLVETDLARECLDAHQRRDYGPGAHGDDPAVFLPDDRDSAVPINLLELAFDELHGSLSGLRVQLPEQVVDGRAISFTYTTAFLTVLTERFDEHERSLLCSRIVSRYPFANTIAHTVRAPSARSAVAAVAKVAPDVDTSSTRTTVFPRITLESVTANAPATFSRRRVLSVILTWAGVFRVRRRA